MSYENQIKAFEENLINEEKATATIEKYIRDVKAFFKWCKNQSVTKQSVLEYKDYLIKNYSPVSVNSMLSSLNSFFDFSSLQELKTRFLKIQKSAFTSKSAELTKEEYQRLLKTAKNKNNERLYYLMQTICSCGIRVSEISGITVEAIKYKEARIHSKGKIRVIIIPKELCRMLSNYAKNHNIKSGSIFVTKSGKPLDRSTT